MGMKHVMASILFVLGLCAAGGQVDAQPASSADGDSANGAVQRVRGVPVFYERQGDSFRRMPEQPAVKDLVGMTVEEVSPRGYVRIRGDGPSLWVARSLVVMEGAGETAMPKARCQNLLTVGTDTRTAGVRGAGEGCGK